MKKMKKQTKVILIRGLRTFLELSLVGAVLVSLVVIGSYMQHQYDTIENLREDNHELRVELDDSINEELVEVYIEGLEDTWDAEEDLYRFYISVLKDDLEDMEDAQEVIVYVPEIIYVDVPVYVTEIVYVDVPVIVEQGYTQDEVENIIEEFIEFTIEVNEHPGEYFVEYDEDLQVLNIYVIDTYGSEQGELVLSESYTMLELIKITK